MNIKNIIFIVFCLLFFLVLTGCDGSSDIKNGVERMAVNKETLVKVFQKKIYFGHQSVGKNILSGVSLLAPNEVSNIIEVRDEKKGGSNTPGFYHSLVGANLDPKVKVDDFRKAIETEFSGNLDVAFLKFCYLDISKDTNVESVFVYYKSNIMELKKKYPHILFIHFTIPLTINSSTWKTQVKKMLGKDSLWEYADNIKRNEFNQMLLNEYQGSEPVFDLAAIESTRSDGKREFFTFKGKTYYALAKEYTRDGGHLNDLGSRKVGAELLEFLAEL